MSILEIIAYTCFTIAVIDGAILIALVYRHWDEIKNFRKGVDSEADHIRESSHEEE